MRFILPLHFQAILIFSICYHFIGIVSRWCDPTVQLWIGSEHVCRIAEEWCNDFRPIRGEHYGPSTDGEHHAVWGVYFLGQSTSHSSYERRTGGPYPSTVYSGHARTVDTRESDRASQEFACTLHYIIRALHFPLLTLSYCGRQFHWRRNRTSRIGHT